MASEITGSGTNIDDYEKELDSLKQKLISLTIEKLVVPSVKVSPDEHSTPKIAQISPGPIDSMSWDGVNLGLIATVQRTIPPSRYCACVQGEEL